MIVSMAEQLPQIPQPGQLLLIHKLQDTKYDPPRVAHVLRLEPENPDRYAALIVQLDGREKMLPVDMHYREFEYAFEVMP